jgi:hypothetical protein
MMAKEKTFQSKLTASECILFRFLREIETDHEAEIIYHGTDPRLFVTYLTVTCCTTNGGLGTNH